jgi:oligoendopeptidase F
MRKNAAEKVMDDALNRFPPRFVPAGVAPTDLETIERLVGNLLERECPTPTDLERWLEDVSELTAWVSEGGTRRRIAALLRTDDEQIEHEYLTWVRDIQPQWERLQHRLMETYLQHPQRASLPSRYEVFNRATEAARSLYRDANLTLFVAEAERVQAYQKLWPAMVVTYQRRQYARSQAWAFLASTDRAERETVWRLLTERALADRGKLDALFDELLRLRNGIARNANCRSYRDYAFKALRRFDYGPDECEEFREAVEAHFVPLATRVARQRCQSLGIERQRPWDVLTDPLGRKPPRAPENPELFLDRCESAARLVSTDFGDCLRFIRESGLIDIGPRKGKATGVWQFSLPLSRTSFLLMNGRPTERVRSLFHELGHAVHYRLVEGEPLVWYRDPPLEIQEVASYTMELLTASYLGHVYESDEDANRGYRELLDAIVVRMPWVAAIDQLQHWIYTHPRHTADDRRLAWTGVYRRFHPEWVDWSDFDEALAASWQQQTHVFVEPFYYIEYGIATLAALDLWRRANSGERSGAVAAYRAALSLGGSRPLPDLFGAAGVSFRFDATIVAPAAAALEEALDKVPY